MPEPTNDHRAIRKLLLAFWALRVLLAMLGLACFSYCAGSFWALLVRTEVAWLIAGMLLTAIAAPLAWQFVKELRALLYPPKPTPKDPS